MYSAPMPGENIENAEAREKARREAEAIANGENFNPNLSAEAANGFNSLAEEVPFAGDAPQNFDGTSVAMTAAEIATEGAASAAATVAVEQGLDLMSDIINDSEENSPTDNIQHVSANPIGQEINQRWDAKQHMDLDNIQQSVEQNYRTGAIEDSALSSTTEADIANIDRNSNAEEDTDEGEKDSETLHNLAEATGTEAISVDALSEQVTEDIKAGKVDALEKISDIEQRAANAESLADKTETAVMQNGANSDEAIMASDVAAQAREKAQEAIQSVQQAKSEYDSMSEEEKEETRVAAEAAETNGTTLEEEKKKLENQEEEHEF